MIEKLTAYIDRLSPAQRNLLAFVIFAFTIAMVYLPTVDFKYCIDDQYYLWLYIEDGSSFMDYVDSLRQRFWHTQFRPVTFATILVEALMFGKDPGVHHFFNLIYYTLLCYLIYLLVSTFLKKYEKHAYYLGLFIAFFFLMHPSHTNVVSSIKNREAILSMLFGLMSMRIWWKFLDTRKVKWIIVSVALLLMGILAKKDVMTFILLIPISGFLYSGQFKFKRWWLYFLLFLVLLLISNYTVLNFIAEPVVTTFNMSYIENPLIGEEMSFQKWVPYSLHILSIYEKFMLIPTGYLFYFGYDQVEILNYWNGRTLLSLLVHILILIALIYLVVRKKYKYLLGPVIFFVSIAPFVLTIVSGIVAVRYSFIASLGFSIVAVQLLLSVTE